MANKNTFANLTLEELQEKRRKAKAVAIGMGIVMLLAITYLIYTAVTTKNYAFIAIAAGCSVTFLPVIISLNQMNTEIKSRRGTDRTY